MSFYMKKKCPKCGGQLWNDTEFGMVQCMDCDWYTVESFSDYVGNKDDAPAK